MQQHLQTTPGAATMLPAAQTSFFFKVTKGFKWNADISNICLEIEV